MKKLILIAINVLFLTFSSFGQNDLPLKIMSKPTPIFTEQQNRNPPHVQGTITLRVEFLADGQIGQIVPVNSLPFGLTENAIEAARKMTFEPSIKNNVAVSIKKQIQYSYFYSWVHSYPTDEKAEAVLKLALQFIGGNNLPQVKNQVSSGYFTVFRGGVADLPNAFVDVISYPDKERTEFKQSRNKVIQTNSGEKGWIFDGGTQNIREQRPDEIENFKRGIRTSLDSLFRGAWRATSATLSYVGKRQASLGKRNDVIKLTYPDGFAVEFEFSAEGMPMKSLYKKKNDEDVETLEEDRFAQFVEVQGVKVPFIVDHYSNGIQTSRINYDKIEFNKKVPDTIFDKPNDVKQLKKDLKF